MHTAFTNTLGWPKYDLDQDTIGSVVCTVYTGGQLCKPYVLCKAYRTQGTRLTRLSTRVNGTYNRINRGLIRVTLGPFSRVYP